jgi:16S rRNA (cytosine967-C5)-methyltransferase
MHPPLKRALVAGLAEVFNENQYSDRVLERTFKQNKSFGSRDRRQVAETFYSVVRHWRRFLFLAEIGEKSSPYSSAEIERVVDVALLDSPQAGPAAGMKLAQWCSVSDELMQSLQEELGELKTKELLHEMDVQAPVFLRTNRLKISRDQLLRKLSEEGFSAEACSDSEVAIRLIERKNVFSSKCFQSGFFEVQDIGSQQIAPLLGPKPGSRVVDACAGAGGKSLHLADLMQNRGKILSLDIHQWKLDELHRRFRRAGVDIIETRLIESSKTIKRLHDSADFLLLDVPCSGSGVLRRNPDTKLRYTKEEHQRLCQLQQEILQSYSKMLRQGGVMVYSTCSVFPSENENQVMRFLEGQKGDWNLDSQQTILPTQKGADGFYMARLSKL